MPDSVGNNLNTNWNVGEKYNSRSDNYNLSDVATEKADAKIRRDRNRSLIDSMFPAMGKMVGSHEGSQSNAPDAQTTPSPQ